jgi:HlyD family secretion protein
MSPNDKKSTRNRRRRWPWLFLLLLPVLLLGLMFTSARNAAIAMRDNYTTVKPTVGAIAVTVYGSGSIEAGKSDPVYAPATGRVETLDIAVGDSVQAGDVLAVLSSDALDAMITQYEATIKQLDAQIAAMPFTTGSATIAAPVAGRILAVYAAAGDPVASVMDVHDALLVLSGDGTMKVAFASSSSLKAGDSVTVKNGSVEATGTVLRILDGTATVLVADGAFANALGLSVDVLVGGTKVGSGSLEVSAPVYVTATSGIVKSVAHAVGTKVSRGATLFTLKEAGYSATFLDLVDQRATALADLRSARDKKSALTLVAPADGVVQVLNVALKGQVGENQLVAQIGETASYVMQVLVDELDIAGVQVGQTATLSLSAFSYKSFPAKVEEISAVGRTTGGVTTYPVTLRIDAAAGMKIGMSANADILVAQKSDALTIPIKALKVDGTRTYVTVVLNNGTRQATTAERDVTVGLTNGNLVEIVTGLVVTDEVQLVDNTASGMGAFFGGNRPTSAAGSGG